MFGYAQRNTHIYYCVKRKVKNVKNEKNIYKVGDKIDEVTLFLCDVKNVYYVFIIYIYVFIFY